MNLNIKVADLHAILVESVCRNIRLIEIQQENQSEDKKIFARLPEIMHFKPQSCGHLLTIAYPDDSTSDNTSKIIFFLSFSSENYRLSSSHTITVVQVQSSLSNYFLITVIYVSSICSFIQTSHIISVEYRKALHKALALDLTRPCFRRGNAVKFNTYENEILVNPHQALLVKGTCIKTILKTIVQLLIIFR